MYYIYIIYIYIERERERERERGRQRYNVITPFHAVSISLSLHLFCRRHLLSFFLYNRFRSCTFTSTFTSTFTFTRSVYGVGPFHNYKLIYDFRSLFSITYFYTQGYTYIIIILLNKNIFPLKITFISY